MQILLLLPWDMTTGRTEIGIGQVYNSKVQHIVSLPMNQSQGKAVVPIWMILRTLRPSASSTSTADTRTRLREMTEWKCARLASRGNPEQVQTDSSSDSLSSNEDENENLSSRT